MSSQSPSYEDVAKILNDLEPVLSGRATNRFDGLKSTLSKLLKISQDEIYISTIDKSSNANARTQQMLIRQELTWKVFVGICLSDDLDSISYESAARRVFERSLESKTLQDFQGMIWMNKKSGAVPGKWSPGLVSVRQKGLFLDKIEEIWPGITVQTINVKALNEEVKPESVEMNSTNLEESLGWPRDRVAAVIQALTDKTPQIILSGPPGTGKTYAAKLIASHLLGTPGDTRNAFIEIVQFHPSYGYEDFLEGLRPNLGEDGSLRFENSPGVILRLAREIQESNLPRVLIIDEINRANLARVFGELMYLLEYRESNMKLMSNEDFNLPSNLFIIGTMNTADRGIRSIDLALRRRFDFFEISPDVEIIRRHYLKDRNENQIGEELLEGFVDLNHSLATLIDRHHLVGHSFFMLHKMDKESLRRLWEQQIFPLIEEYFFDRPDLISEFTIEKFWQSAKD